MPVMPAVAPATSSVFRSAALKSNSCANREPIAPPVMMIGPSAPNGPPLPIEMAEEMGFRIATLSDNLLSPNRMVSIASGIPCPRILSDPNRAMSPTIRPPAMGISSTSSTPRLAISAGAKLDLPYQATTAIAARMSIR
jgi:hypothetical protein